MHTRMHAYTQTNTTDFEQELKVEENGSEREGKQAGLLCWEKKCLDVRSEGVQRRLLFFQKGRGRLFINENSGGTSGGGGQELA